MWLLGPRLYFTHNYALSFLFHLHSHRVGKTWLRKWTWSFLKMISRWRPSTAYLPCSTCRGKCCVTTSRMPPTMTRSHLYRRVGSMESGGSLDIPMVSTGTLSGNLETDSTMNGNSFLPRKLARDGKIWTYSSRERNSFWWTTPNQLRNNVDSS